MMTYLNGKDICLIELLIFTFLPFQKIAQPQKIWILGPRGGLRTEVVDEFHFDLCFSEDNIFICVKKTFPIMADWM